MLAPTLEQAGDVSSMRVRVGEEVQIANEKAARQQGDLFFKGE
jgi:hypothetical protein